MKRALLVCALLLVCSAAKPTDYYCEVQSLHTGHGTHIGQGLVLDAAHLHIREGKTAKNALVDKALAELLAIGADFISEDYNDDGCDWALLYVPSLSGHRGAPLGGEVAVGDSYSYWHGKQRREIKVVSLEHEVAGFTGPLVDDGDSGSGVFDKQGRIVGIITSGLDCFT